MSLFIRRISRKVVGATVKSRRSLSVSCKGCIEDPIPVWEPNTPQWVYSSEQSPYPKLLTPPPPSHVVWPKFAEDLMHVLVHEGFQHMHFFYRPRMYLTGAAHDQGKESMETFFKPGPLHPTQPTPYEPGFPINPKRIPSLDGSTAVKIVSNTKQPLDNQIPIQTHPSYPSPESMGSIVGVMHFGPYSTGFPGLVHGGLIATTADFYMYKAVENSGISGFTVNLNVDYRNVIPVGNVCIMRCNVQAFEGRKATAHFGIFSPDHTVLYAEGSAIFVRPKDRPHTNL